MARGDSGCLNLGSRRSSATEPCLCDSTIANINVDIQAFDVRHRMPARDRHGECIGVRFRDLIGTSAIHLGLCPIFLNLILHYIDKLDMEAQPALSDK